MAAALYLSSPEASFVAGEVLNVNGAGFLGIEVAELCRSDEHSCSLLMLQGLCASFSFRELSYPG